MDYLAIQDSASLSYFVWVCSCLMYLLVYRAFRLGCSEEDWVAVLGERPLSVEELLIPMGRRDVGVRVASVLQKIAIVLAT